MNGNVEHGVRVSWRFAGQTIGDPVILAADLAESGIPDGDVARRCNRYGMFRGRKPGHGAVLMRKGDFDDIPHPQRCQHTLTIEARDTVQIKRLCVTRVEVLSPNISQRGMEIEIGEDAPCIVEIADARYYAEMSGITAGFNWRNVTGRFSGVRLSYLSLVSSVWQNLQPVFGAPLELAVADLELQVPEQLAFHGISAWDALWIVLDLAGWSFTLLHDGTPRIFNPKTASETERIVETINRTTMGRRSRWDTLGESLDKTLPERVRAITRSRDYQWWQHLGSHHSGDLVEQFPTHEQAFQTAALLGRDDLEGKEITPGTEQIVWGTVPLLTNDRGEQVNAAAVSADLSFVASRYLQRRSRTDRGWTWIYSLLWPFFPNSHISAVGFSDVGGEFTQTVLVGVDQAVDWKDGQLAGQLAWDAEQSRPGAPDFRSPVPYGRELYGVLVDHFPPRFETYVIDSETYERTDENGDGANGPVLTDNKEPLPADEAGIVWIQSGHLSPVSGSGTQRVAWISRVATIAFNATGRPIRMDRRVFGKWNYQIGVSGVWVIVAAGAETGTFDPADWAAECVRKSVEIQSAMDPGKIVVDKRRMLKLIVPEAQTSEDIRNPKEIGLSFYNSPNPCSVLATPDPGDEDCPIVWDDSPCLKNLQVTCWIKFGQLVPLQGGNGVIFGELQQAAAIDRQVAQALAIANQTWVGPSRIAGIKIRLPPPPDRSHQFLISGPTQAGRTELDWFGPGLSGYFEIKAGDLVHVDNGLILKVEPSGEPAGTYGIELTLPQKVFGTEFEDCPPKRWNPCGPCDEEGEELEQGPCSFCLPGTGLTPERIRISVSGWPSPGFVPPAGLAPGITSPPWTQELLDFVNADHILEMQGTTCESFMKFAFVDVPFVERFEAVPPDFEVKPVIKIDRVPVSLWLRILAGDAIFGDLVDDGVAQVSFTVLNGRQSRRVWGTTEAAVPFDCSLNQQWLFPDADTDHPVPPFEFGGFEVTWRGPVA